MTITIKNLGNGQLPSSTGDLYTVPAATTAWVKIITLVNTNTVAETVNLYYLKSGGTARRIVTMNYSLSAGYYLEASTISMGAGDKIQGDATDASKVDYVISGFEIS
jgi:hypothetical protein